ncbi:chemotaxis protein CheX [Dactylosporangium sp. CA-139066]|uniref:chemotaxis protein CheX n=1 Tax=Dactylosporangium sp. CA-139066 TaxID=3239930 RepID=UPI003D8D280E
MRAELDGGAVTADALQGIVWQVWTAYLGGTAPAERPAAEYVAPFDVTGAVAIAGAWHGHVILRCRIDGMAAMAAAMLELPANGPRNEDVRLDDIVDAAGELLNIVAGNVKSLLPQPAVVALPQVVLGEADVLWPGASPACELRTGFDRWPVLLTVMEVDGAGSGWPEPAIRT